MTEAQQLRLLKSISCKAEVIAIGTGSPSSERKNSIQVNDAGNIFIVDRNGKMFTISNGGGGIIIDSSVITGSPNPPSGAAVFDAIAAAVASVPAETATSIAAITAAAIGKTTPVDADTLPINDSAASNGLKKVTFSNLKAWIKTYLDSLTTTFTNKRITQRVQTVVSSATVTPAGDTNDAVRITAQAVGLTIANPSGTPTDFQTLVIAVKDNGTSQTLAFGTVYEAVGVTLPTATVINKWMYFGIVYNTTATKWQITGYSLQA